MRSYCAVYVDVGYLLASAATRVTGSSLRSGIEVDYAGLIAGIVAQVEADSGLPLLRVNWYDSGARSGGQPDYHQDQIGLLPRIKLRLGRLSYAGEQKGVDVRLGLDLALQSRARVADVVYLVSGDDDLTEAVEEAQSAGVQVVLLSVPGPSGHGHAVSKHLRRAADGESPIDTEIIDGCVRSRALAEGLVPTDHDEDSADDQEVATADGSPTTPAESPDDAAAASPVAAPAPSPTEARPSGETLAASTPAAPTPAVFGRTRATGVVLPTVTVAPTWSTSTGDLPVVDKDGVFNPELIDFVAKTALDSWCRTATPDALVSLRTSKPMIPGELDRALLLDLSSRAGVYDIDDSSRHEVRERFWFHVARVRLA